MNRAIIFIGVILLFLTCKGDFNTNHPVPPPKTRIAKVFPKRISGLKRKFIKMSLPPGYLGFKAIYGNDIFEIRIIQSVNPDPSNIKLFFKQYIAKEFSIQDQDFIYEKQQNLAISLSSRKKKQWYGWTNQNWIFLIGGEESYGLEPIISSFPYISRF